MSDDLHKHLISLTQRTADDVSTIKTDIGVIQSDLAYHMRRTQLAEERLEAFESEIRPLRAHVIMFSTAGKLLGVVATGVGVALGVAKLAGW